MRRLTTLDACLSIATGAALLGLWAGSVRWSGTRVFPSPGAVLAGALELARSGRLLAYVAGSLGRVGSAFSLAMVTGIPVGMLLGLYPPCRRAVAPVLRVLRPISPLAWVPIAILVFGVGDVTGVLLIFLPTFLQLSLATAGAMASVPRMYLDVGHNFGLGGPALFARVVLPASFPTLVTGVRIAFWSAWQVMVAAEMIAVDSGLGYMIIDARNAGKRYDLVLAGMFLIGSIGLLLDSLIHRLETLRWVLWAFREA